MTVITLTNVPQALKGDLTKWMQEISTGVYVGKVNSRVREKLWERVLQNIGNGEATLAYSSARNELGYEFEVYRTKRVKTEIYGIPLISIPVKVSEDDNKLVRGYSKASKLRKAKVAGGIKSKHRNLVVLDIETSGLDFRKDKIIEVGAIKVRGDVIDEFNKLVKIDEGLPEKIVKLTGITDLMLREEGESIQTVLLDLLGFIEDLPLVGYNIIFDLSFLNAALGENKLEKLGNQYFDILKYVKREKMFLNSYTLDNVLDVYEIEGEVRHRALEDAYYSYELFLKVNGLLDEVNKEA